jgi:uncharacterized membrane protein YidH (DUF202 family)
MSPPSVLPPGPDAEVKVRALPENVSRVLDPALGFFVWAVHLVTIYVITAISCQFGLGAESAHTRTSYKLTLVLVTMIAIAIVALHAARRYQQQRSAGEQRFRTVITVGCDAIAIVAMAGQLLAILLVPACV